MQKLVRFIVIIKMIFLILFRCNTLTVSDTFVGKNFEGDSIPSSWWGPNDPSVGAICISVILLTVELGKETSI